MYHDINKKDFSKFEEQIKIFKNDGWKFINPGSLKNIIKKEIVGKKILLTFDDGFFSNYLIEKKILSKHKIKAAYFIPYRFMVEKNKKNCHKFIKYRLKINNYDYSFNSKINCSLKDIIELEKKKHVIGFHTKNHLNLSKIKSKKKLKDEIAGKINAKFKRMILKNKFFSYPFGKTEDISKSSYEIAKKEYDFIFLGIRGENNVKNIKKKRVFFRDNFSVDYDKKMTLSILNGFFDIFYIFKRKKIFKNYIH